MVLETGMSQVKVLAGLVSDERRNAVYSYGRMLKGKKTPSKEFPVVGIVA